MNAAQVQIYIHVSVQCQSPQSRLGSQFSGSNDVIVAKTVSSTTVAFSDGLIKWLACSTSKFLKRQLPRREIHNIKFYQNVLCRPPSNKNHKRNCLMTTTSTRLLKSTLPVVIIIYYGSTVVIAWLLLLTFWLDHALEEVELLCGCTPIQYRHRRQ